MNMFRNLLTVILLALAIGLFFSDPTTWHWLDPAGPHVVSAVRFLGEMKPFSYIILLVISLALWMTRKQF
jgi:hypothetical protein